MNNIQATVILNPFKHRDENNREVKFIEYKNQRIRDIFCEFYPIPSPEVKICCSVNGKVYEEPSWDMELKSGDNIVFVPIPQGGGGGGSNPVMIVAMVAVAALAWWAGGAVWGPTFAAAYGPGAGGMSIAGAYGAAQLASGLVSAAIMIGGGMLISSIMPQPKIDGMGTIEQSPTYNWGTATNSTQEGSILPVIIGERRVSPTLISSHTESIGNDSYLYLLYAVSEGSVEDIYGFELNNQPITFFTDVSLEKRLGTDNQTIIPSFNDVYSDKSINSKLQVGTPVIRETSGTGINAAQVHVSLPLGLWYANSKGGMDEQEAAISIHYRKKGSANWITYVPSDSSSGRAYVSGKIYEPGEVVSFGGSNYICKFYQVCSIQLVKYNGSGDWFEPHEVYSCAPSKKTTKTLSFGNSRKNKVSPQPAPPDTTYWENITISSASLVITGASNSPINKSYKIAFPEIGQYEIMMNLVSAPPEGNSRYGGTVVWSALTEIIYDDLTYPGTALAGLKIKASDQLSGGLPSFTSIVKKTQHTFSVAGTKTIENPAWALYYVLTNDVWGGGIPESKIDLATFQSWADYCTQEELKVCIYIDTRMSFNEVKNMICEVGRAQLIQRGLSFSVIVDKPSIPTQLFTVGNIVRDSFKMNFLPFDDRANCIRVSYFDKDANWEKSVVEIRDKSFNTDNKEKSQDLVLYACDDKTTAIKHAILLMNYNKHLLRTVSFDVSIDALACTVGDVVYVQHDVAKYGFGGRIEDVVESTVKLDRAIDFEPGIEYDILIRNSNNDEVIKHTFMSPGVESDSVILPNVANIEPLYIYSIGKTDIPAKPFRIVSITRSQDFVRKISAIEYYDEVYNDENIVEYVKSYIDSNAIIHLSLAELPGLDTDGYSSISASWTGGAGEFQISYKVDSSKVECGTTKNKSFTISRVPINKEIFVTVYQIGSSGISNTQAITLDGEISAVYENGVYELGAFATPYMQQIYGNKIHTTLWLQEPNNVAMSFTDV